MTETTQNLQRVEAAMDAMRRAITGAKERLDEGLQLTRTQLEILVLLAHGPQTTGELARQLFLTQSAVTQTIDTLVRRQLVTRRPAPADRRLINLELSAEGRTLADHIGTMRRDHLRAWVNQLTPVEIEALISATQKLTTLLEDLKTTTKVNPQGPQ